jgi:predicted transcriptional regulator
MGFQSGVEAVSEEESEFPVHWVSKEARYRIIDLMLSTRSIIELARVLGVSPTAVRKYVKRISHPSDVVLAKAINAAEIYERESIIKIVIDDLIEALSRLYKSVDDRQREVIKSKLSKTLGVRIC